MDSSDFIQVSERLGIPVAILLLVFLGIYWGARWLSRELVIPIRTHVFALLAGLNQRMVKYMDDQTEWMRMMGEQQKEIRQGYDEHHAWEQAATDQINDKLDVLLSRRKNT